MRPHRGDFLPRHITTHVYRRGVVTEREDSRHAFAALGEYVYEFSWLCQDMKRAVTALPRLVGPAYEVSTLLMGEMTAHPLTGACFALLEQSVADSPESIRLVKALKRQVVTEIERRNDFMHGDWMIGWSSSTGVEGADGIVHQVVRELPPTVERVKPGRSSPQKVSREEIAIADLERETARLRSVRRTLEEFLFVVSGACIEYPTRTPITLTDLYSAGGGKLSRTGPKSAQVRPWKDH